MDISLSIGDRWGIARRERIRRAGCLRDTQPVSVCAPFSFLILSMPPLLFSEARGLCAGLSQDSELVQCTTGSDRRLLAMSDCNQSQTLPNHRHFDHQNSCRTPAERALWQCLGVESPPDRDCDCSTAIVSPTQNRCAWICTFEHQKGQLVPFPTKAVMTVIATSMAQSAATSA